MKTALITGANRGIGLEFSKQYATDGWRVLACSRHASVELEKLSSRYPDTMERHVLDVSDHEQIAGLSRRLEGESIDLLVNNAGIYPESGNFRRTDYEKWAEAFRINTMAPLRMAEAFFEQIARSEKKTVATITSKMGSIADNSGGGDYPYRSSKAALNMVMKSLALDLKSAGIAVVLLHPGWVRTDMGGPGALISVEQSVSGMREVIDGLVLSDSGKFFAYDGKPVPW